MDTYIMKQMGMITEDEFIKLLGITKETVAGWRYRRKAPPFSKVGNQIFYSIEDVKKFIAERMNTESAEGIL